MPIVQKQEQHCIYNLLTNMPTVKMTNPLVYNQRGRFHNKFSERRGRGWWLHCVQTCAHRGYVLAGRSDGDMTRS
jgi:hypothetical protein